MKVKRKAPLRVLITGGPTRAYLDRVRFLTNFSSGALAYELCKTLARRRIEVALVSGPTAQPFDRIRLARWEPVETTDEMRSSVMRLCREFRPDVAVFSAAVLDFAPVKARAGKVSSRTGWTIRLRPTPKIIDEVGRKYPAVRRVGFKLEWKKSSEAAARRDAKQILTSKGLDALCLNYLSELTGSTHPAILMDNAGNWQAARSKPEIARWIAGFVMASALNGR